MCLSGIFVNLTRGYAAEGKENVIRMIVDHWPKKA